MSGLSLADAMQASQSPTGSRPRQILLRETQGRVGGRIVTSTGEGFLKGRGPEQFFAGTGTAETSSGCGTEARVGAG
jgi:protoporphyrinogen oxidase